MDVQQYISVSTLNKYIKRKFDADPHLDNVFVKGEISNLKHHTSGHLYFTLKDEGAVIQAVMFRPQFLKVPFQVENGMKVFIEGQVTVYEKSGSTQIYVKKMQKDGVGDLFVAFQQMKERLEKEGLFSPTYKKNIPAYPNKIGIVTSQTGAAIRDMVTTIKRRYPIAQIVLYPAIVQGVQGATSISSAIEKANLDTTIDVLIVGRGGGSIEDLWNFNEEKVARAIFQSKIPIISAVGHETDTTIADFVADLRAPTPTGAAEIATPDLVDLQLRIQQYQNKIVRYAKSNIQNERNRLLAIKRSYAFRAPMQLVQQKTLSLDALMERMQKALERLALRDRNRFELIQTRLTYASPTKQFQAEKQSFTWLTERLNKEMSRYIQEKKQLFQKQITMLRVMDPLAVMVRGYSVTFNDKNETIKSVKQVKKEDHISIHVNDGYIDCIVEETRSKGNNDTI